MTARIGLRVSPSAARSEVVGRYGAAWKVRVAAPPEGGRANRELVDLLTRVLDVPRARLDLVAGATARDKVIQVEGLTLEEVERRLGTRQRKETT